MLGFNARCRHAWCHSAEIVDNVCHPAQVVAVMLQLHIRRLQDPTESGIVLVLGAADWQRDMLRAELRRLMPELAHHESGAAEGRNTVSRSDSGRGIGIGSLAALLAAAAAGGAGSATAAGSPAPSQPAATPATAASAAAAERSQLAGAVPPIEPHEAPPPAESVSGGIPPAMPVEISNEISAQERVELYRTRFPQQTPACHFKTFCTPPKICMFLHAAAHSLQSPRNAVARHSTPCIEAVHMPHPLQGVRFRHNAHPGRGLAVGAAAGTLGCRSRRAQCTPRD